MGFKKYGKQQVMRTDYSSLSIQITYFVQVEHLFLIFYKENYNNLGKR